jgi:hypothetical protein
MTFQKTLSPDEQFCCDRTPSERLNEAECEPDPEENEKAARSTRT